MAKQNLEKIREWQAENVDRIEIKPRKTRAWPDRIAQAGKMGLADSRQEYIIQAVEDRLRRDGIPAEE